MKNLKVRNKLNLILLCMAVMILAAGICAIKGLNDVRNHADEVLEEAVRMDYYFRADDTEGNHIVLLGSATEGTNRMETVDGNGYQMAKNIIAVGQEEGGGYSDDVFPKAGETENSPKRSYSNYINRLAG